MIFMGTPNFEVGLATCTNDVIDVNVSAFSNQLQFTVDRRVNLWPF
jgi:hypothetical protein